ncbi:MAG: response regulator transcription factor [Xanthomonadales bacterium]|nr:response regulator transcription factor [Xanthomonadales bacterium]
MRPTRVVLADDHALVLGAFRHLLSSVADSQIEIVGTAANGRELIKVVREQKPDVVVTDISMPLLNGLDAGIKLLKLMPGLKIIFLTVNDDPDLVADVIRAGAKGYLLKNSVTSELLQAIRAVASGSTYITPLVTGNMLSSIIQGDKRERFSKLTVRQREILQLLAEGRTMKETARVLSVTPRTVAFHKYRIMETLGVENNAQLIRFAVRSGLLPA